MGADTIPQALTKFLELLPEDDRKQLKPVTSQALKMDRLLHMSKDNSIEEFVPTVTRRASENENHSIARICTSPTLAGSIMGYASDANDFFQRPTTYGRDGKRKVGFRGGWTVYGIPFDIALRPSSKMVPDVERSDEHWLVTYDEENVAYKPEVIAKFYYASILYEATARYPRSDVEMIFEVMTDTPIPFDNKVSLTRGCWRVRVKGLHSAKKWSTIPCVEVTAMPRTEYTASKRLVASMLSFQEAVPPSMDW